MRNEVSAYIDRIEDGRYAVLIAESIGREFIISREDLPEAAGEGSYLTLTLQDGELAEMAIDSEETDRMAAEIEEKLQKLRARSKKSKFRRG